MREIKFRFYSKDAGQYAQVKSVDLGGDFFTVRCLGKNHHIDGIGQLEQFTGLRDKNGKEIYEGDILENPDYEEAFVVEYHEGMAGYVGWGDDKIAGCYLITGDEIEIIGSIHENPELLEASC